MTPLLTISDLTIKFGGLIAIDHFNMSINDEKIHGIIGPNGAGKTTIFNAITGIYKPTKGSITINGNEISHLAPYEIARHQIARTFQNIRLFSNMTVIDNLIAGAYLYRKKLCNKSMIEEKANQWLNFFNLSKYKNQLAETLPYGTKRILEIARALMINPKILLLDEPAAGLNPTEKTTLKNLIREIADQGITILLIEHDMAFVMSLCQTITVLNRGSIITIGSPSDIQSHPKVIEAYLGSEMALA